MKKLTIPSNTSLQELKNTLRDIGIEEIAVSAWVTTGNDMDLFTDALAAVPDVKVVKLNFHQVYATKINVERLIRQCSPTLQEIHFEICSFNLDEDIFNLFILMPNLTTFRSFDTHPTLSGSQAFRNYLSSNPSLKVWNPVNFWSDEQLATAISGLTTNTNLETIFSECQDFGPRSARVLARILQLSNIKTAQLFYNNIDGQGHEELYQAFNNCSRVSEMEAWGSKSMDFETLSNMRRAC